MRVFYEAEANRFWTDRTFDLDSIPVAQCVELTEQQYADFMAACAAAGGNPGPGPNGQPIVMVADWRTGAIADLAARGDRLKGALSGMQSDYITNGDMVSAALCRDAKTGLNGIKDFPAIAAVLADPASTRAQFNAAVVARWKAIAAPAPPEVHIEFARYATAA